MSFQITILKVLAGQADEGRATLAELTRQVSILVSSAPDWTERTKRLAALAPGLDIFGSRFVFVDNAGWQITDAGRAFLLALENPAQPMSEEPAVTADVVPAPPKPLPPPPDQQPASELASSMLPPSPLSIKDHRPPPLAADRKRRSSYVR